MSKLNVLEVIGNVLFFKHVLCLKNNEEMYEFENYTGKFFWPKARASILINGYITVCSIEALDDNINELKRENIAYPALIQIMPPNENYIKLEEQTYYMLFDGRRAIGYCQIVSL